MKFLILVSIFHFAAERYDFELFRLFAKSEHSFISQLYVRGIDRFFLGCELGKSFVY
jgi:hypothetical protein